jgi:hypothetical protein
MVNRNADAKPAQIPLTRPSSAYWRVTIDNPPIMIRRPSPVRLRHQISRPTKNTRMSSSLFSHKHGLGCANEMPNRPQTLYALADSPVGLAAWMIDHDSTSEALIARVFDGKTEGLTRDDILDNNTLYWFTNTAISSAQLYWEASLAFSPRKISRSRLS